MLLQISGIGLLVTKAAFLYLENFKFQEYSFEKKNSILTGNNVLDASTCKTDILVFERYMVCFILSE
jgi:hypothetical protein